MVPLLGAPLGFGAGHAYAGDPWRGALVGVGGVAVLFGSVYASTLLPVELDERGNPSATASFRTLFVTVSLSQLAYGAWAAYDAYRTAEASAPAGSSGSHASPAK